MPKDYDSRNQNGVFQLYNADKQKWEDSPKIKVIKGDIYWAVDSKYRFETKYDENRKGEYVYKIYNNKTGRWVEAYGKIGQELIHSRYKYVKGVEKRAQGDKKYSHKYVGKKKIEYDEFYDAEEYETEEEDFFEEYW